MCQMFSIGERSGQQAGKFITQTLLLQSHAVVIAAVCGFALSCWNTQGLSWNRCRLEGSICCSKTFIYLSAFIVPYKTCKVPIPYAPPYHQRFWLYNWMLISRWKVSLHFSPEDMAFVISNKNVKFGLVWPWVRMSDAVLSEGPKNKGIQQRSLALSLMHPLGDFSSSLNLLMILCTVDDEICKAFAIWHWGTLFLKYSTIFLRTLSQIGEPLPIFTSERLYLSKTCLLSPVHTKPTSKN